MKWRVAATAILLVILTSALAQAGVCPICLKQIPDDQKYCARHQTEIIAKRASSQEEGQVANEVARARKDYKAKLEALKAYYIRQGNAEKLKRINAELADFDDARKFAYVYWEDTLPELNASETVSAASRLLAEADRLRKSINPFNRKTRFQSAAKKYADILVNHPNSTAVHGAAFGLGELYGSGAVGEYRRAVTFYELSYRSFPKTLRDPLYRAAKILDKDLADYEKAARYYWMTSNLTPSAFTRRVARKRLASLQKAGFGLSYLEQTTESENKETQPS